MLLLDQSLHKSKAGTTAVLIPIATATKYHKLNVFQKSNILSYNCGGQKPKGVLMILSQGIRVWFFSEPEYRQLPSLERAMKGFFS